MRSRVRSGLFGAAALAGILALAAAISAAIVGPSVARAARDGRTSLMEGSAAVLRKDPQAARVEFAAAAELFDRAQRRLSSPLAWPMRAVPVVSTHHGVSSRLAEVGVEISSAGVVIAETMETLPDYELRFENGRVDLELVRQAQGALATGAAAVPRLEAAVARMPGGWVLAPLEAARRDVVEILPGILDGVRKAEAALGGLPSILAEGETKRYVVAFSNLSELRGIGGLFGYTTALSATHGDLDLEDNSGRPDEIFPPPAEVGLEFPDWFPDPYRTEAGIFQNLNLTTDFPSVGSFVLRTAEAAWGDMDGVIAVDPLGIAALLGLTGPIEVPSWPSPLEASNVGKVAMHDVYLAIPDRDERELFFEELVRTTFDSLVTRLIRLTPETVGVFDEAVRAGNFRMFSEHEADQAVFQRLGAGGEVARAAGATDVLSVVSQNATGSKADWYLRRDIRYEVALEPENGSASSNLNVTFRNTAPATGLPDYIIGSALPDLPRGTNRQIAVVLRSPAGDLSPVVVNGQPAVTDEIREGPLRAYRSTVDAPALGRVGLQASSRTTGAFYGAGDELVYRLHVLRQPVAYPDFVEIQIRAPRGWALSGQTRFVGDLTQDEILEVGLTRTTTASITETIFVRPWRLARSAVDWVFGS